MNLLSAYTVTPDTEVKVKVKVIQSGILQARMLEWVAFPFSRGIFPIQGSNPDLPHCRQILYLLSHRRSSINVCQISKWASLVAQL